MPAPARLLNSLADHSMRKCLLLTVFAAALSGCATPSAVVTNSAEQTSRIRGLHYVREYVDINKVDNKDVYTRIRMFWDYTRGVTVVETFDMDRNLLSTVDEPGLTPNATEAETARVIALTKAEPKLKAIVSRPAIFFHSGFVYREGSDSVCAAGSRCIHVFVSEGAESEIPLAHAIVDLMTDTVVHPFFAPEEISGKKVSLSK